MIEALSTGAKSQIFVEAIQKWNDIPADVAPECPQRQQLASKLVEFTAPALDLAVRRTYILTERSDSIDKDDIRQEGLISIFYDLASYDPSRSGPNNYCFISAHRGILDWIKKPSILGRDYQRKTRSLNEPTDHDEGSLTLLDALVAEDEDVEESVVEKLSQEELERKQRKLLFKIIDTPHTFSAYQEEVLYLILEQYAAVPGSSTTIDWVELARQAGTNNNSVFNARDKAFKKIREHRLSPLLERLVAL